LRGSGAFSRTATESNTHRANMSIDESVDKDFYTLVSIISADRPEYAEVKRIEVKLRKSRGDNNAPVIGIISGDFFKKLANSLPCFERYVS
jgi:hypothetical protein